MEEMKTHGLFFGIMLALLLALIQLTGCTIPYAKLSDELSVKQLAWPAGMFYRVETRIKNTSDNLLDLKVVCDLNGEEKTYNIKVMPWQEVELKEKVMRPLAGGISAGCEYYKR